MSQGPDLEAVKGDDEWEHAGIITEEPPSEEWDEAKGGPPLDIPEVED